MWSEIVRWWAVITAVGWASWPFVGELFPRAQARGYAYARACGLVLVTYLYWLGCSWGVWSNGPLQARVLVACCAIAGAAMACINRRRLLQALRRDWVDVVVVEVLFLVCVVGLSVYKAHDAGIWHTEQPMDFAFLNACLRSRSFPPNDPWMAGMQVSYYYLGYLVVALITQLSGVAAGVGYNLGLVSTLAVAVVGLYGLLRDLLGDRDKGAAVSGRAWSVIGAVAILGLGNLEGVVELFRVRGWGSDGLYQWLGIPGLQGAAVEPGWLQDGWWWWRASRVMHDANLFGRQPELITEFPAFSFVLGDLHPHFMALPVVIAVLGLGRELYLAARDGAESRWPYAMVLLGTIILGALGFANSWDWPTMACILLGALILGYIQGEARPRFILVAGLSSLVLSIILYVPFYRTLQSQVRGLGVAYYAKTPLKQYLLHFGVWLVPAAVGVYDCFRQGRVGEGRRARRDRWLLGVGLVVLPWVLVGIVGGIGRLLLGLGGWVASVSLLIPVLATCLVWSLVALRRLVRRESSAPGGYLILLLIIALVWTYGCEFFYVRDVFETRMNTVFKVYYQAWVLLGIVGVVSLARLWYGRGWRRWVALLCCVLTLGALYWPVAAAWSRVRDNTNVVSLDGTEWLAEDGADEYAVWRWLMAHAHEGAVLVEAVGNEYHGSHNRLSSWSGIPTILGWPGHEVQWRGDDQQVKQRQADVKTIYTSSDGELVGSVLAWYGVDYVVWGPVERALYDVGSERAAFFQALGDVVFQQGAYTIYGLDKSDTP